MPVNSCYDYSKVRQTALDLAKIQVLEKFPNLQVGSSGYDRAVQNRFLRNLKY